MTVIRRAFAAIAMAGAVAGASVFLSGEAMAATPTAATPTAAAVTAPRGCDYNEYRSSASMVCHGVSFTYRAYIKCHDGINGVTYTVYGKEGFVSTGRTSHAACSAPQRQTVSTYGFQLR